MTRLCGQRLSCAKPRAHEGDCATYEELAACSVAAAVVAFLASDSRPVDDMSDEAYAAWRVMVDAAQEWQMTRVTPASENRPRPSGSEST